MGGSHSGHAIPLSRAQFAELPPCAIMLLRPHVKGIAMASAAPQNAIPISARWV